MQNVKVTRKGKGGPVPPRIYILFAREAPTAVIFRRGPSDWFQLLRWNKADDTFASCKSSVTWKIFGYPEMFRTRQPDVRVKSGPDGRLAIQLTRSISGLDYSEELALLSKDKGLLLPLDEANWVDWDQQGRLVFARHGKLLAGFLSDEGTLTEHLLVDLNDDKPESISSPDSAKTWEPERSPLSRWAKLLG